MKILKPLCAFLVLLAVTGAFFGVPYLDWACRIQPSSSLWFVAILALSFLWGRLFCEALCPLGFLQSVVHRLFHPFSPIRRVCSRLPETVGQKVLRYAVLAVFAVGLVCGCGAVWAISPYAIYGKALALFVPGLAVLGVVLVLSALGKGRFWCNAVCPFGTLFNLISKVAWRQQKIGPCCRNCRACFRCAEPKDEDVDEGNEESDAGVTRRETLRGVALLAAVPAAEKLTDGGLAPVSYPVEPPRERPVLPPGAGEAGTFARRCVGCDLCVKSCPGNCLTPSADWKRFGQPEMTFAKGSCIAGCTVCGEICPAGALERLDRTTKANTHVGYAVWHSYRCLRKDGVKCRACIRKCPVGAIHEVDGVLVVDREACVGCGACEHVCAARPAPAMVVMGLERQRTVRPMSESDLLDEMLRLVHAGQAAVVVARNGVIAAREQGSGVKPILDLLARNDLRYAVVVDKIVGRAAAAVAIVGGARKVFGVVMSTGAKELLERHGVVAEAGTLVETIVNRENTGPCPMDTRIKDETDPVKMVELLRR